MMRTLILAATQNPLVSKAVRRYGMRMGAARFVAGETLDEAVVVLRALNAQGLLTNTTLLGEAVRDAATVRQVVETYLVVLDRIHREALRTNVALKLSQLGLDLSEDEAFANVARLAARARELGNFVRIDMEESARVDATLRIYRRLRAEGLDNVGTVLQSYLYRTPKDLDALLPLGPNLRIVKGAYLEPPDVAFPRKADVDARFIELAERMLLDGRFTAIATHDERIIDHVRAFVAKRGIGPERYEFQMLYGVRSQLQLDLARQGYRVRVATPYGPEWYYYLMRRLAERPANVLFLARNLLRA
ncbi:MAG TPA: proline dehydrogenase family protein [Thermodesulfobacteriota bacterium]